MEHMILYLGIADNPIIQLSGKGPFQNPQVYMLHMKDTLETVAELLSHTGGKEKFVYYQDQKHCSGYVNHTKPNGKTFFHGQSSHRQGKTGNKSRMDS